MTAPYSAADVTATMTIFHQLVRLQMSMFASYFTLKKTFL